VPSTRELLLQAVLATGTLFAIVNPISTAFVFNRLARGHTEPEKRRLSRTASIAAAVTLGVFLLIGRPLMAFFGITLYAFRVAGGLYLGKVAFDMLGKELRNAPEEYTSPPQDIAIIPLAIPLLSGPGAMTTVMVMREKYAVLSVVVAILAVCLASWAILHQAPRIDRALGQTGTNVVERVLGLVVLVIAIQFVFNGISGYMAQLPTGP